MGREEVIDILRRHADTLRERGVTHAALFGSVARGDSTPQSDIDIMIELDPGLHIDVFAYAGLKRYIADLFATPVDVVNRDGLKAHVRGPAIADAIYAF
jgi:predicted nucleotidyltransferase